MGEYFRDRGQDALIIYDDLTKQAWAYRQSVAAAAPSAGPRSLPGRRFLPALPPARACRSRVGSLGREADQWRSQGQDRFADRPARDRNAGRRRFRVRSDQRHLDYRRPDLPETDLFNAGIRPAINAGISVSRVGGAAQTKLIKKLGGGVRLALAQYRELAAFAQFASDLDEATRKQLERGKLVTELMKQPQYVPLSISDMAVTLYASDKGYFDDVEVKRALECEKAMIGYLKGQRLCRPHEQDGVDCRAGRESEKQLAAGIQAFKSTWA